MKRLDASHLEYVLGPYATPIMEVLPGEEFLVDTEDCYSGIFQSEEDLTPVNLVKTGVGFSNPVTGPIRIRGAAVGDAISIKIHSIELPSRGVTRVRPHSGVLDHFAEKASVYFMDILEGHAVIPGGHRIPLAPMIGTIGVSPHIEAIPTVTPGPHGGNLDCRDVGPGCELILPVFIPGASLFLGDVHATQGDGEFSGAAAEVRATVRMSVDIISPAPRSLVGPRIKRNGMISTLAADKPLDEAVRAAVSAMIDWMVDDYGFDRVGAYLYLTNAGFGRVIQMVNPIFGVACTVAEPGRTK